MITSTDVTIQRPQRGPMSAYLAAPAEAKKVPTVIVIHEIYGLNDNIRSIARRFAGEGYVALAVDLFSGGTRALCLLRVMGGLMLKPLNISGLEDLRCAIAWMKGRSEVDPNRIGAIGFCMGGGYALALACLEDDVRASSVFYAMNPRSLSAVADACPIVGSYPEKDFTKKAAVALEEALTRYEVPHDIKIYNGAQHSFFNDQGKKYNAPAAEDSWKRTLAFFETHLRRN